MFIRLLYSTQPEPDAGDSAPFQAYSMPRPFSINSEHNAYYVSNTKIDIIVMKNSLLQFEPGIYRIPYKTPFILGR